MPRFDASHLRSYEARRYYGPMQPAPLRYFHQVARLGSIRRASEQLNVAASAISRQIALLEHEMGQPLIERLPRGVRLTDAGEIVARHLRETDADYRRMRGSLDEISGGQRGVVKVAMIEGMIAYSMPEVVHAFNLHHPHVRVEIAIVGSAMATDMLRTDECDVAVVFQSRNLTQLSLDAERVEPFCAVMAPTHPLAGRQALWLAEVALHSVVLNDHSYATRNLVDQAAGEAGVELRVVSLINSIEGAKALARVSVGVVFLPSFAIQREMNSGELVAVPLRDKAFADTRLMLLSRRHRRLPIASDQLRSHLVAAMQAPVVGA